LPYGSGHTTAGWMATTRADSAVAACPRRAGGGLFLVWPQTRPREIGYVPPPDVFVWRHDAPGTLSPQEAYSLEGRVEHTRDFSFSAPVATLWAATTSDAALALVQLMPAAQYLDERNLMIVTMERMGGPSGTWSGTGGNLPGVGPCTAVGPGCLTLNSRSPTHQIQAMWSWKAANGATGIAVRFSEPLTQPAQEGVLAGVTYYAASREPASGAGGAYVVLGTKSQATVDAIAEQMASTGTLP
jgi:hypothetical protein